MTEINEKFAAHVTAIAFSLQLSRPQIVKLVTVATQEQGYRDLYRLLRIPDASVTAGRILEDKGLVYVPDKSKPGLYKLTEPGWLVFQLLQAAGLVSRIEERAESVKIGERE